MPVPARAPFVATRRIGDATVTIISEGVLRWAPQLQVAEVDWRRAMPEAGPDGVLSLGLNVALVQVGDCTILIDPGYGDPSPDSPIEGNVTRSPGLRVAFESLGVRFDHITHVLITHPHHDHIGGVTSVEHGARQARFAQARHFLNRADWQSNPDKERRDSSFAQHLGTVDALGLLELIDSERLVAPGVTMLHAPGETLGHSIVRITSAGDTFYYVGDLFHHTCEVEHTDWVSPGRDQAEVHRSRVRVIDEATASRATLVYTHGPFPPWGRIVRTDGGARWEPA